MDTSGLPEHTKVELKSKQWAKLQDAHGSILSEDLKIEIITATTRYLRYRQALDIAPKKQNYHKELSDWLYLLDTLLKKLRLLQEGLQAERSDSVAVARALYLPDGPFEPARRDRFSNDIESIADGLRQKLLGEEFSELPDPWKSWVYELAVAFRKHGFVVSARADQDTYDADLSPFPRFIRALQDEIKDDTKSEDNQVSFSRAIRNATKRPENRNKAGKVLPEKKVKTLLDPS